MTEVKLTADLNEAIDQVAEKLGLAASEIIPHYIRLEMVRGISWCIWSILMMTLPWLIALIEVKTESSELLFLWFIARWGFLIVCMMVGAYNLANMVENIVAAKAMAINRLLNQIRE